MKSWLTEYAVGIDVTKTGATAALVTSATLIRAPRFTLQQIVTIERAPGQPDSEMIAAVLDGFRSDIPVIPVSRSGACIVVPSITPIKKIIFTDPADSAIAKMMHIMKPLRDMGGEVYSESASVRATRVPTRSIQAGGIQITGGPAGSIQAAGSPAGSIQAAGSPAGGIQAAGSPAGGIQAASGILSADSGHTHRQIGIINGLASRKPSSPGAVSLMTSIRSLSMLTGNPHHFCVVADAPRYTVVAIEDECIRYCRSFLCRSTELAEAVDAGFRFMETRYPEWHPPVITWLGVQPGEDVRHQLGHRPPVARWMPPERMDCSSTTQRRLNSLANQAGDRATPQTDPVFHFEPDMWLPAAGAAVGWMIEGSDALMRPAIIRDSKEEGVRASRVLTVPVTRRSALLLRCACFVFLLSLLAGMGSLGLEQRDILRDLNGKLSQTVNQKTTSRTLPGVTRLPGTIREIRNHLHLEAIADTALRLGIEADDILVTMSQIEIQGRAIEISAINGFNRELARYFDSFGAIVQPPVTTRDTGNRLQFRQNITWGQLP